MSKQGLSFCVHVGRTSYGVPQFLCVRTGQLLICWKQLNYIMVRVTERGSGSGCVCVGISDVTIAFIKDVVVSSAAFHILIKAQQRFIQTAVVAVTKDEHECVRFALKVVMNTVCNPASCSAGIPTWWDIHDTHKDVGKFPW